MRKLKILLGALSVVALTSCGGNTAFDANKSIVVVVREDGSGTKSAFLEILGLKGAKDPKGALTANSTSAVLTKVSTNQYAIAYDSLGYVDSSVKIVKVDNVAPTSATIKDGSYALSRPLNVIYKAATLEDEVYKDYYNYLSSKEVQDLAAKEGYVSVLSSTTEYSTPTYTEAKKITISGSTSLQPLMLKIAAKYMEHQKNVTVEVSGGGSGTGYNNAENGVSNFGMISEEFNSSKAASCTYFTVCKDGIALIVNLKNPVESISKANLSTIYNPDATTPITTWSSLIA